MARSVSGGVTKGSRWLLVKNPEEVDDWRNEHQRLDGFLKPKQPLANACSLEEHVCGLWPQRSKGGAAGLVKGVSSPNWPPLSLGAQRWHILDLYNHRFSTGPVKGTINKIRTMQR